MIDTNLPPEWRLVGEVLRQAIEDAQGQPGEFWLTWADVQEARSFCTASAGDWAEARLDWCEAGGFLAEFFRNTAIRKLAGASA